MSYFSTSSSHLLSSHINHYPASHTPKPSTLFEHVRLNPRFMNKIAVVYVYITRQNVIMTLVDFKTRKSWLRTVNRKRGFLIQTIRCVTAGQSGFRGKRKTTPFAINLTTKKLLRILVDLDFTHVRLVFRGNGFNRDTVLKTFLSSKHKRQRLPILSVTDVTLPPHNGCRPKNRKRR